MNAVIGKPIPRVDGPAKVTGGATYAAEFDVPGLCHAAVVASTVPRGRIMRIDTSAAEAAPGVLAVLTHANAPRLPYQQTGQKPQVDAQAGEQLHVLQDPEVRFNGQPIALVVAETLEQAGHAAPARTILQKDYRLVFDHQRWGQRGEAVEVWTRALAPR